MQEKRTLQRGTIQHGDRKRQRETTGDVVSTMMGAPRGVGHHPVMRIPLLPPVGEEMVHSIVDPVCEPDGGQSDGWEGAVDDSWERLCSIESPETPMIGDGNDLVPSTYTPMRLHSSPWTRETALKPRGLDFGEGIPPQGDLVDSLVPIVYERGGDESQNAVQPDQGGEEVDLWAYDASLLRGGEFPSGLSKVKGTCNDMKMFAVFIVKCHRPSMKQTECFEAVSHGYSVLVDRWASGAQEQDSRALLYVQGLSKFANSTVRRRFNRMMKIVEETWPIETEHVNLNFKTFATPRYSKDHAFQATVDSIKAAMMMNAHRQHMKHKEEASSICASLLEAVRPDKVAKFVLQEGVP